MALQKLNIPNKTDNAAKKKLVASNEIGTNETLLANEVNALIAKTNELVDAYNFGAPITAFNFKANVPTYADLANIVDPQVNDGYGVLANGLVYVWNGTAFPPEGQGMNLGLKPDENSKVEEGNPMAVAGGEVYAKVVNKTDVSFSGLINYSPYIVENVTINGQGETISSTNGRIVQDMPIDTNKGNIVLENIVADNLKKIFFKDSENNIVGSVVGLTPMPYTASVPTNAATVSFAFIRNVDVDKTLLPKIYYETQYVDEIIGYKIKASELSDDLLTLETVSSTNYLNRAYIQTGKYINSIGEVLPSGNQNIVESHPISEYAGQNVTFNGYLPISIKKLVFRDSLGIILGGVHSLTTAPYTVLVPELAETFDMSVKSALDSVSDYDELRMNIGTSSLPYEPFEINLIAGIKGVRIYAEKSKESQSGGEQYDQSLNTTDDVIFNSVNSNTLKSTSLESDIITADIITANAIQFHLPEGNGTPPVEVEVGDAWVDTSDSTIKVKLT